MALTGCTTAERTSAVVVSPMPEGIYLVGPSRADEVHGWPEGWAATIRDADTLGGFVERHGYGTTPEEAIRNAGGYR